MKSRRLFSPVEAVKSLLIFLLTVLMLVLVILLVIGQNRTGEETLPQADRMVIYASGVQSKYVSGMDTERVSPYLLAYRQDGKETCVIHASDTVQKPYAVLYPLLRVLFGADGIGYAVDADAGEALWSACIGMPDSVYVRYHSALPSSVIRAYTYSEEDSETVTAALDDSPRGHAAYVRELFLIPAEQLLQNESLLSSQILMDPDAICAVTMDDRGEVALFLPGGNAPDYGVQTTAAEPEAAGTDAESRARVSESVGVLEAYIASMAALSVQVQTGTLISSGLPYGTTVSLDGIYAMPEISRYAYDPGLLYDDPQKLLSVLGLLGLREGDADNYYTDGAGDRIYLNASGRLTVSETASVVRYVALQEGGLDPAGYLGYASIGRDYTLSEYLRAADKLLSQLALSDAILGGDVLDCSLVGVEIRKEEDADVLLLTYGYTYNGIPLLDGNGELLPAMLLRASGGVITELELHLCDAASSDTKQYLLPQSVMAEAMALEQAQNTETDTDMTEPAAEKPVIPLYMAYLCDSPDGFGSFTADWIGIGT